MEEEVFRLRLQVEATEAQLQNLRIQLRKAEAELAAAQGIQHDPVNQTNGIHEETEMSVKEDSRWPLTSSEYQRYGRQMIMPEIGLPGQLRLKEAKVLIVGVGGLGCPAAAYLAGAGVGTLGLVDGDTVEASNLHRQIAHATTRVGMSKVESAYEYLRSYVATHLHYMLVVVSTLILISSLNPEVRYNHHTSHLSSQGAVALFETYDLILDCTDHPTSRYLISDACVLAQKPLVSASALKMEGQLIVLNDPPKPPGDPMGGPCYRCIFPKPPPADSVLSCGEGGILGPVVGVMGVLQALEAIKLLTRKFESNGAATNGGDVPSSGPKANLLMFSAYSNPQFRSVRLRSRKYDCAVCSSRATITAKWLSSGSMDYVAFCGRTSPVSLLPSELRITARNFANLPSNRKEALIDVRDATQFGICSLPGSINIPWTGNGNTWLSKAQAAEVLKGEPKHTYVVCRFGNDSQLAVKALMDDASTKGEAKDIKGGFQAWRMEVDSSWPEY
jgi:adenylyltransferase and sulfurtransferase